MSNIDSVIAVVKNKFKRYGSFGVLDDDDMYRSCVLAIKSLGNNATSEFEDVVYIKGGKAQLPDNFYRLKETFLVEPLGYEGHKPKEIHYLVGTRHYELMKDVSIDWNECNDCCKDKTKRLVKKEYYFKEDLPTVLNFSKSHYVMLTKGTIKQYCDSSFRIPEQYSGVHQVSIQGNVLHANFSEGYLYVRYAGFPVDERGYMDFEDSPNSNFERYIEACLKVDIVEGLILQQVAGVSELLGVYKQDRLMYKTQTSQELKYKTLNAKNTMNKIFLLNAQDFAHKSLDKRHLR